MAERSMFFRETDYNAEDFAGYFRKFLMNGVYRKEGTPGLRVLASGFDMSVSIGIGAAFIYGYLYEIANNPLVIKHDIAEASFDRIDTVALRWDRTESGQHIKAVIVKGTPSSNPQPPTLRQDVNEDPLTNFIYELPLADVRIVAGKSFIEQNQITTRVTTTIKPLIDGNRLEQLSGRNVLINGAFDIWQRGPGESPLTNATRYLADRWRIGGSLSGVVASQNRVSSLTLKSQYFHRLRITANPTNNEIGLTQRIEDVRTFSGEPITLSFKQKADKTTTINLIAVQNFGNGGSSSVSIPIGVVTLSSSFDFYEKTFEVPSIIGKIIGEGSYFEIQLLTNEQSLVLDTAEVQLERGKIATPFERRPIAFELNLCQRYFYKTYNDNSYFPSTTSSGSVATLVNSSLAWAAAMRVAFPNVMRTAPTVQVIQVNGPTNGDFLADRVSDKGFIIRNTSAVTNANFYAFHAVADAEL